MTDLIFTFDTEDYVNEKGADGIIEASKMVRDAGFTPCHNVVAWLAEALVKWGRQDCIDELKQCEIHTHSLKHSYHPTINEYTDIEDFDEATRRFRAEEDEAFATIKRILGDHRIKSASPPGASVSYVAQYGYSDMGVEIFQGGYTHDSVCGRPVSFCNLWNIILIHCIDNLGKCTKDDVLKLIDEMAKLEVCILLHHPQMHLLSAFTDRQNFDKKNNEGEWILGELLPEENIKRFEENFAFLLERIKEDERFNVTTYNKLADKLRSCRVVTPDMIPELKRALDEDFFPVTTPESLCLTDIFFACRDFLLGKAEHECGKVYGFLDVPYTIPHPVKVTAEEMRESASRIRDDTFLPTEIIVGGKKLGPSDWLRAALAILSGEVAFTIVPDKWQIDLNEFPLLRNQRLVGWWIHSDSFKDEYISDRARLQTWTIRLPKGTKRRIY